MIDKTEFDRLREIDTQAAKLARSVLRAPEMREGIAGRAAALRTELLRIASRVKPWEPDAATINPIVSEALLDLNYAREEGATVTSLRLARTKRAAAEED